MNFKLTKLKTVGSIIIALIINFIWWFYQSKYLECEVYPNCPFVLGDVISKLFLQPIGWALLIFSLIIIYVIWGLFEKELLL